MDIDSALWNWSRWVRERKLPGRCRSIESRFRLKSREDDTPTGWGDYLTAAPASPPLPPVDALAAVRVEVCMHLLPARHRKALKFVYVYGADAYWCARRLAMRPTEWSEFLARAQAMLRNILTEREKARKFQPHYLPPPSTTRNLSRPGSGSYEAERTSEEPA